MFRLAAKVSKRANHRQHQIGAVIVKSGRPIAFGFNSYKSHPMMGHVKTLHAEVAALLRVKGRKDLKDCEMYVFRAHRNGDNALSKPCPICERIIKQFGIRKVHYTTYGGWETLNVR